MHMGGIFSRAFAARFTSLLVVALAPLVFYVAVSPVEHTGSSEQAAQTARTLDHLLQLRLRQTFTFAAFPSLRAFAASALETRSQRAAVALNELQAWVAADPFLREALIVDAEGRVIMTTGDGRDANV